MWKSCIGAKGWFQSTPSGGKATLLINTRFAACYCFNPRLPGGRRRLTKPGTGDAILFQSTPSGGKATLPALDAGEGVRVSIHAFRGEGDARRLRCNPLRGRFNPRLPGGRRRRPSATLLLTRASFNPRLPGGRRRVAQRVVPVSIVFQSTPSGGKATVRQSRRL